MRRLDCCVECGLTEDEHHDFAPVELPDSCVCDFKTWGDRITPVCDAFLGAADQYCLTCEHDLACHTEGV